MINLKVLMENEQLDTLNTTLAEVPCSTQLSVQWVKKDGTKISTWKKDGDCHPTVNNDLLQVAVNNQVVVFDLQEEQPQERFYFYASQQFMNPEMYVDSGISMVQNYEDTAKKAVGHLQNIVVANRDRSNFFLR